MNESLTSEEKDELIQKLTGISHQMVCLRNISHLLTDVKADSSNVYNSIINLVPEGFQFPDQACVRLWLGAREFQTANFKPTKWLLASHIEIGDIEGGLEVFYLEKRPSQFEGPFLLEEKQFLQTVAREVGLFEERFRSQLVQDRQLRELDLYASLLRHDLRNDVGVLLSNVDLIRMTADSDPEIFAEAMNSTEAVCERMLNLLTAFGQSKERAESGIAGILRSAVALAENASSNLTVDLQLPDNADYISIPSSRLLPLVFDNLLRNAVVHAGAKPHVEISMKVNSARVHIIVSDNGPGVHESVRERLFEKGASTRGGGLGLFLSREVLSAIGGSISLAPSKKGEGARFHIELPTI